jgi:large subunit ribosomal protein L15
MQIHTLIPKTKNTKTMIVGRGGKRGKTSGRGGKGQTARAGNKRRPELRDFIKRIPKLRGRGVNSHKTIQGEVIPVNLNAIETKFQNGSIVSPKTLVEAGVVNTFNGKIPRIKILALGEITKKLSFENCIVSDSAKTKIEKVGGSVSK